MERFPTRSVHVCLICSISYLVRDIVLFAMNGNEQNFTTRLLMQLPIGYAPVRQLDHFWFWGKHTDEHGNENAHQRASAIHGGNRLLGSCLAALLCERNLRQALLLFSSSKQVKELFCKRVSLPFKG